MLRWKIYAVFLSMLSIWSVGRQLVGAEPWTAADVIGCPITALGLLGLIAYAFSLKLFTEGFWKVVHLLFLGWMMFNLRTLLEGNGPLGIKLGAVVVVIGLMGFNWFALYRLAGSPWEARIKHRVQKG